jgi:glycosyltransferase involved in cell wall biosynthesis
MPIDYSRYSNAPFATACVLSYNRPAFLETAISTMVRHAGAPLEVIVHDDGSEGEARRDIIAFLDGMLEDGLVSTVILNPPGHNQGQGIALNRMFSMAKGNPIIKLDHDLIFEPGWLWRVNEILERNRRTPRKSMSGEVVHRYIEPEIGLLGLFHYHHEPVNSRITKLEQYRGWQSHTHICGSAFALTRHAWNRLGPFDEHSEAFAEDYTMQLKVSAHPDFVCALPDDDLVHNQGFGVGPSTVVPEHGKVAPIHFEPVVVSR